MAFKMNGSPAKMGTIQGTAGHSSALKMKMEKDSAAKMKKEAAMKMKMESAAKMKKESAMKAAQIKNQAKKDAATTTTKPDVKAIDKGQKITAKADIKKAELTENVTRKLAKNEMKSAKRMKGKDSKEFLQAKKEFLQAKEDDRQGKEGGKRQGLFRKLSSKINKRRQAKLDKKLAEKK